MRLSPSSARQECRSVFSGRRWLVTVSDVKMRGCLACLVLRVPTMAEADETERDINGGGNKGKSGNHTLENGK